MKIVATSPSFSKHPKLIKEIKKLSSHVKLNSEGIRLKDEALIEFIDDAEAVVVGLEKVDSTLLDACSNLKIVAKYGVGLDNIDIDACKERGITIGWSGGVNRLSVAEMALGFMLSLSRNLFQTSLQLKAGAWNKNGGFQLTGKTIGIIGVGHIGKEVIRLLEPFHCKLLVNDIIQQDTYYKSVGAKEVSKETIFKEADIITIHTPLTLKTKNMINSESLALMHENCIVINSARGGLIDEDALKEALSKGQIKAAAIDVYSEEPPTDASFLTLNNLFCTPHIGGNANEAVLSMGLSAIYHIMEFQKNNA